MFLDFTRSVGLNHDFRSITQSTVPCLVLTQGDSKEGKKICSLVAVISKLSAASSCKGIVQQQYCQKLSKVLQ